MEHDNTIVSIAFAIVHIIVSKPPIVAAMASRASEKL